MGYYSTVLVKCDDTAYTRIKEVFAKYKNEYPTQINKDVEKDLWILFWENKNHWKDYCEEVYDEIIDIVQENSCRLKLAIFPEGSFDVEELATDNKIDLGVKLIIGDVSSNFEGTVLHSI
ncbi:MAG: hypothetical protein ACLUOO_13475 [Coprococcus sp.]